MSSFEKFQNEMDKIYGAAAKKNIGTDTVQRADFKSFQAEMDQKFSKYDSASCVDGSYINQFIHDANAFAQGIQTDYEKANGGNIAAIYAGRKASYDDMRERSWNVRQYLENNKGKLNSEAYTSFIDDLNEFDQIASDTNWEFYKASQYGFGDYRDYEGLSSAEIRLKQQEAQTGNESDYGMAVELQISTMPMTWKDAEYWGYDRVAFDEVERKRTYLEKKYGVNLHDPYDTTGLSMILEQSSKSGSEIAYTTMDGKNVTWQMLYDQKVAEEDLAKRLAAYSQNADWDTKSKGVDVSNDPDRANDYKIAFELSRTNVAYDKRTALADGISVAKWNDIEQKRQYINNKYGVDLHANIYDDVHILNEIMKMLDDKSWESGELLTQFYEDMTSDRTFKNMRHLTEDERAVLNYIFYTQGRDAALSWHNSRMNIYQNRANGVLTEEMYNLGQYSPVLSSAASVAMNLGAGVEWLGDIITGQQNHSLARASSAIRSGVSENTDWMIGNWDAFDFVYNTGMSVADSKVASKFGKAGGVLRGMSVAAQATNDALDRGMSQKQAFWSGLMAGVFDELFEIWSVRNFRGLKKVAYTHAEDIALNKANTMLGKASDASLKEVANIAYDTIINGDFSQYETKVRQYVFSGMTEAEAKKKAALEFGSEIAETIASSTLEE